jgi:hypothetical protein
MNDKKPLTFATVRQYRNRRDNGQTQRELERARFKARLNDSKELTNRFAFASATRLRYKRDRTPSAPLQLYYTIHLGLAHAPKTPVQIEEYDNDTYTLRSGSLQSKSPSGPSALRAVSCSCPDFSKRTKLYRKSNRPYRQNFRGGPCVSNAYGCKHMMAANMFLGLPATEPTDVDVDEID